MRVLLVFLYFLIAIDVASADSIVEKLKKGIGLSGVDIAEALESGLDINPQLPDGSFAIHLAAENGLNKTIKLLEDAGVDLNLTNQISETILHIAVRRGNTRLVLYLLQKGFNPNSNDAFGESPISSALSKDETIPIAAILFCFGAKLQKVSLGVQRLVDDDEVILIFHKLGKLIALDQDMAKKLVLEIPINNTQDFLENLEINLSLLCDLSL